MARQFIVKHQELQVYELAFEMAVRVFEISRDFPEDERSRFAQPMVEAARLVAVKIARGWQRRRFYEAFVAGLNEAEAKKDGGRKSEDGGLDFLLSLFVLHSSLFHNLRPPPSVLRPYLRGHRGYGQFCHCCADREARLREKVVERRESKQVRHEARQIGGWDLSKFPKAIFGKVREVLTSLGNGVNPGELGGKRFGFAREMMRIPDRTKAFALRIIRLYTSLPKTTEAQVIGKQVLRNGTSIGAHYREAKRSRSDAEYISKTNLATQELEETGYWIELLIDAEIVPADRLQPLLDETKELIAIFVTLGKKAKTR